MTTKRKSGLKSKKKKKKKKTETLREWEIRKKVAVRNKELYK